MQTLTSDEYARLRSAQHRVKLYVAVFGKYRCLVTTKLRDARKELEIDKSDWEPILNIGPHRLTYVGSTIGFDARDSWKMVFDSNNNHAREQGYGAGSGLPNLDWKIFRLRDRRDERQTNQEEENPERRVWQSLNQNWQTPQTWSPTEEGLYQLSCSVTGTIGGSKRWIRVHSGRRRNKLEVTEISGLSGEWGAGWGCSIKVQDEDITAKDSPFANYQCVGIYAEEEWWDEIEETWVRRPIGADRQEPRVVMIGYVKEGSIKIDHQSYSCECSIESVTGQMSNAMMHKIAIWNNAGPDTSDDTPGSRANRDADSKANKKKRKQRKNNRNDVDGWGAVLKGFKKVSVTDFAIYALQMKTNILRWHDFYACYDDEMADLESVAGQETDLLSNLQTVAANDWYVVGADHANALYFAPDRLVSIDNDWEEQWPVRMVFKTQDIWEINTTQMHMKEYKYVKLVATRTADFMSDAKRKKKARRQEDRNQIEAWYPQKDVPVDKPGNWFVKSDLLHDNQRVMKSRARRVYEDLNNRWETSIVCGLNRAVRPGDYVRVGIVDNKKLWSQDQKQFLIKQYSADIDVGAGTWKTTLAMQETVDL